MEQPIGPSVLKLGHVVCTRGVSIKRDESHDFFMFTGQSLLRHESGDWGDVCAEDKAENDRSLKDGDRILSSYTINETKIWIITEWDRSVTTVLFPDEY